MTDARFDFLSSCVGAVPPGRWTVGVSGGADSVSLLLLLHERADVQLHIVHLDHQTRGPESTADAEFVRSLAAARGLPCTISRRAELEQRANDLPANLSAKYRALRLMLFREAVHASGSRGVLLAHHADDQAETILGRLLRGSGYAGLAGMSNTMQLPGLLVLRPLLPVQRELLRDWLITHSHPWREDGSNHSGQYQRNRLRVLLRNQSGLTEQLLALGRACREARDWARSTAPRLAAEFEVKQLAELPVILARESAGWWLREQGVSADALGRAPGSIGRLIHMAGDAASAACQSFPTGLLVRRRRGCIKAATRPPAPP